VGVACSARPATAPTANPLNEPDPHTTVLSRYERALAAVERRSPASVSNRGHTMLTFESDLEADYLEHRRLETLPITRLGLSLAVLLYGSFFLVDALFFQRYQYVWTVVPILVLAGGMNLALLATTYRARFDAHQGWMGAVAVFVNAGAFAFASAQGYAAGVPIPPEAAVIQQLYTLFLLNLPFRFCMPLTVVIVCNFCLLHVIAGLPADDLFMRCFMMAASGVLGTFACFLTERTQRLAWLRARLLTELSEHDSLTGLYNHRVFYQRADQLLRQARRDGVPAAVLVCDVDHFKQFNDTHGHLAGDEALRHVGKALARSARRPLDIAARLGGEEFGVLLYNVSESAARVQAEEVRNVIRGLKLSDGRRVTISIGVAVAEPVRSVSIEALIGIADAALYRAKSEGRDRVAL